MDWWFFAEGTEAEAREFLERFLDDGAAMEFGATADFSLASVPEVVDTIRPEVELVDAPPPD